MIQITRRLSIPKEELKFRASRSSGPGGQNVNKVNTRVTLNFDVVNSPTLSDEQKRRVLRLLANRINRDGVLRIVSQRHRSQAANCTAAMERFAELIGVALRRVPRRRRTQIPLAAKQRRLDTKRHRGRLKQMRSQRVLSDHEV
jgi:ribosome-associated protein